MALDTSIIGSSTGAQRIVVERGPVSNLASAILDDNPVYHDGGAAKAAGLDGVPVPATWGFVMGAWGAFQEMQPERASVDNPGVSLLRKIRQERGGAILHGEQGFEYLGPIVVGDVLVGEGKVVEVYEKESGDSVMTFVVTENEYRNERSGDVVLRSRTNLIHRGKK
jgi:acyl dehydratase